MTFIKSKIFRLLSPKELILVEEEIDLSKLSGSQFFAETIYSAISPGTETAAYIGKEPLRPGKIYPRVVGYCNVARVLEVGKQISDLKTGDFVLTFQSHRSNFLQDKKDFYLKINDEIVKDSVIAYLYHLGYHSLLTANIKQGHNIGVIGAGVLGIATSIMSNISSANTFVFSNQDSVSEYLLKNDIKCLVKDDSSILQIQSETNDTGIDVIINTSNSWNDWKFAIKAISTNGVIVNLGFPGRGEPAPSYNPLDPQYLYTKNITIKSLSPLYESDIAASYVRFNLKRNLEYILGLIKSKKIAASQIVNEEIDFSELKLQYEKYISRKNFMLSTIINWKN